MINVKMVPEKIKTDNVIFKGSALSTYQSAMNKASLKLYLEDPTLINDRGRLIEQARQQVHDDGYQYKKKLPLKGFWESRQPRLMIRN